MYTSFGKEEKYEITVKAALIEEKRNARNISLSICFRLAIITAGMEFNTISYVSKL